MNENESFEEAAEYFHKATHMLMPGKDIAAASGWTEEQEDERQKYYKVWCAAIEYTRRPNGAMADLEAKLAEGNRRIKDLEEIVRMQDAPLINRAEEAEAKLTSTTKALAAGRT